MAFKDKIQNIFNRNHNFNYLDNLVNSSEKEVKLTSDIALDSSEGEIYAGGIIIDNDELVIDGDGHTIDAGKKTRIFRIENKKVTFKNINFINALGDSSNDGFEGLFEIMRGGGAVYAFDSEVCFENCTFKNCYSPRGGAISISYSEVTVDGCSFSNNECSQWGGAIFNDEESSLTVMNSTFKNNRIGDKSTAIESTESSLVVVNCEFDNPGYVSTITASGGGNTILKDSAFTRSQLKLDNLSVIKDCFFSYSDIRGYRGNIYIPENETYNLKVDDNQIHYLDNDMDWVRELTLHELPRKFLEYFPKFDDADFDVQDRLHDEMIEFLEIWREIWSHDSNFVMADAIVNILKLSGKDIENDYLDSISKEGAIDKSSFDELHAIFESVLSFVKFPSKNFTYLDELIHADKDIALVSDICLDDDETGDYADGIKIDVDSLTIDGKNHIIDAKSKTPIFKIDAKNLTIRNMEFKNGFSHMGGAISNIGDVKFENCKFTDNVSTELGGAIVNDEKMIISDCEFEDNSSGGVGGAIAATFASDLEIENTKFKSNKVSSDIDCPGNILPDEAQGFGGAIYNNGRLSIENSEFLANCCDENGGAMIVLPDSKIKISNCLFSENNAKKDGGVMHTMGEIEIDGSEFKNNNAGESAGVFDATESSKLKISNSKFENNTARTANVISNKGKLELIDTVIDEGDILDENSGYGDEIQQTLPGVDGEASGSDETESVGDESDEESSNSEFPEGYDDYAREFKEKFEEMIDEGDVEGKALILSLYFMLWAQKFPQDANLVAAALLMEGMFDEEFVQTILKDYSREEYRKRMAEYDPIDEELSSWFMTVALLGMIFGNSEDDESASNE